MAGSCGAPDATSDALLADFAVHADAFATYHRWVHRAVFSAPELAPKQLSTTLFSPLRLESSVVAAWVVRPPPMPIEAHLGRVADAPATVTWRRIRHDRYASFELARSRLPVRAENRMEGPQADVLMVRVLLPDERTFVTVAYVSPSR